MNQVEMEQGLFNPNGSSNQNVITIFFGYWTCFFVDVPDFTETIVIPTFKHINNSNVTNTVNITTIYSCLYTHKYLVGKTAGPIVFQILCYFIVVIGVIGVCTNIVNIVVLRHTFKESSFRKLLAILAGFDILGCLFAVMAIIHLQLILKNVNRNWLLLRSFKTCYLLHSLGRTGSTFLTILITVERYYVIVHHFRAKSWFNTRRRVLLTMTTLFLVGFVNLPWWFTDRLSSLNLGKWHTDALSEYPSVFVSTHFGREIYFTTMFHHIHNFVEFVLPLPILLVFNCLLYRHVTIYKDQKDSGKVLERRCNRRDVKAGKMFSVIGLSLMICHTFALIGFCVDNTFRDLVIAEIMTVTINSTINFFVYYNFTKDFRNTFKRMIGYKIVSRNPKSITRVNTLTTSTTISATTSSTQCDTDTLTQIQSQQITPLDHMRQSGG